MTDFSNPDSFTTIVVFSEWSIAKTEDFISPTDSNECYGIETCVYNLLPCLHLIHQNRRC